MRNFLWTAAALWLVAGGAYAQSPTPASPTPPTPPTPRASTPPADTPPPPMQRALMLTDEEIRVTIQMLDECVKAKGMFCAEPAVAITKKLQAVLPASPAPPR